MDYIVCAERAGGSYIDQGNAIAVAPDGYIWITGFFRETATFESGPTAVTLTSSGLRDIFVAKMSP